jgi:hypothetical protein
MEKSTLRTLLIAFIILAVVGIGIVYAIRLAPSADEAAVTLQEEQAFTNVSPATIWGTVKWSDGSVASGITVTIGGIGQTTNTKGEYAMSIYQIGVLPVQFESGKDTLLASDASQAEVDIVQGTSIHRDFVITKINQ